MSGKGNCYDNAAIETFFKTIKTELIWRRTWQTGRQASMTVLVEKNVFVPMRDGVRLAADIYRPSAAGQYPVLLQRTPYNKELWPITALTLDPIRAAADGYVVIIEDVRGRWASEGGVFFPYRDELEDGYDSVEWASGQAWSSGKVGCYGLS